MKTINMAENDIHEYLRLQVKRKLKGVMEFVSIVLVVWYQIMQVTIYDLIQYN